MNPTDVETFCTVSYRLIEQIGEYGVSTTHSPAETAAIRQLRAVAAAVSAAFTQVQMMPAPPAMAMQPTPRI